MKKIFIVVVVVLLAAIGFGAVKYRDLKRAYNEVKDDYILNVREWGVIDLGISDSSGRMPLEPPMGSFVKEPVIYFDAYNVDSLSVGVSFTSGNPTVTYPQAAIHENSLQWKNIRFDSTVYALSLAGVKECHREYFSRLNNVQSSPLVVDDSVRARTLFYEGELSYKNGVEIVSRHYWEGFLVLKNENPYTLYNVWVSELLGHFSGGTSLLFYCDSLVPGESFVRRTLNEDLSIPLLKLGFSPSESKVFDEFWRQPFMRSTNAGTVTSLFYRLPEPVVDSLLPMEFSVTPTSITRALYVLSKNYDENPDLKKYNDSLMIAGRRKLRERRKSVSD